jgi:hypothetical protein
MTVAEQDAEPATRHPLMCIISQQTQHEWFNTSKRYSGDGRQLRPFAMLAVGLNVNTFETDRTLRTSGTARDAALRLADVERAHGAWKERVIAAPVADSASAGCNSNGIAPHFSTSHFC